MRNGFLPLPALLLSVAALHGCGREEEKEAPPPPAERQEPAQARPEASPEREARAPAAPGGESAAGVLRRYYGLVEGGRYAEAWAMRSASKAGAVEFARNFAAYESYRVTVGTPTEPVEAGGWAYVEVPIMITGRMKGGEPFGSAGSVSMRRALYPDASAREREWHIFTGD